MLEVRLACRREDVQRLRLGRSIRSMRSADRCRIYSLNGFDDGCSDAMMEDQKQQPQQAEPCRKQQRREPIPPPNKFKIDSTPETSHTANLRS